MIPNFLSELRGANLGETGPGAVWVVSGWPGFLSLPVSAKQLAD